MLDAVDRNILVVLQSEGRITNAELASRVGLTAGPVLARVGKLEEQGFLCGYAARVDATKIGLPFMTFVSVILQKGSVPECQQFVTAMEAIPEVLECHHIAGEEDYLLKVVAAGPKDYEKIVMEQISSVPHVMRVKTILVLSTPKDTTALPIRENA